MTKAFVGTSAARTAPPGPCCEGLSPPPQGLPSQGQQGKNKAADWVSQGKSRVWGGQRSPDPEKTGGAAVDTWLPPRAPGTPIRKRPGFPGSLGGRRKLLPLPWQQLLIWGIRMKKPYANEVTCNEGERECSVSPAEEGAMCVRQTQKTL